MQHWIIELSLRALFGIALVTFFVRGFAGWRLARQLMQMNPARHAELGSPMPRDFWARGALPFKQYLCRFPLPGIAENGGVQAWFALYYCAFWLCCLSILGIVALAVFVSPYI